MNFYFTRSSGEVWQRALFKGQACDERGAAEVKIAGGFTGLADVISYDGLVAWAAQGDPGKSFEGGGVFTTPIGGGDVTTIAPADGGVDAIASTANHVVYTTTTGLIRRIPKRAVVQP